MLSHDSETVEDLILAAVERYKDELPKLEFLPRSRYDRAIFPTIGQYDWLAGQVLYALVRHLRPRELIEFSTSSGYSTTFSALAIRRNGYGRVHSVDIDRGAQAAAGRWLAQNGLADVVELHAGDCRAVVPGLLSPRVDCLFVDTLHSFGMAEWYLLNAVPLLRPTALVHIHDVMPPEARVRIHGGPPYSPEKPVKRHSIADLLKRFVWLALHLQNPNPFVRRAERESLPLDTLTVYPAQDADTLDTIDGNYFEEAVLIRELLRKADPRDAVYLHRLAGRLPLGDNQRYAEDDLIQRTDAWGRPLEWNDALWCRASALQKMISKKGVTELVRVLRKAHYGRKRSTWLGKGITEEIKERL